jgi:hypothetical protein
MNKRVYCLISCFVAKRHSWTKNSVTLAQANLVPSPLSQYTSSKKSGKFEPRKAKCKFLATSKRSNYKGTKNDRKIILEEMNRKCNISWIFYCSRWEMTCNERYIIISLFLCLTVKCTIPSYTCEISRWCILCCRTKFTRRGALLTNVKPLNRKDAILVILVLLHQKVVSFLNFKASIFWGKRGVQPPHGLKKGGCAPKRTPTCTALGASAGAIWVKINYQLYTVKLK